MKKTEVKIPHAIKLREAVKRLERLGIDAKIIKEFAKGEAIPICFHGVDNVYFLERKPTDRVTQFEARHDALVYFVISTKTSFGDLESYLFVSDYEEEWEIDNDDLLDGYAMTWTENLTHPQCSEFGSIGFNKTKHGGLERVS